MFSGEIVQANVKPWNLALAAFAVSLNIYVVSASAQESEVVLDRVAIAEVVAQYAYRWDSKDAAGFASLFTKDGVLERSVAGELVSQSRLEGRKAIYAYAKASHEGHLSDRQTRHHMSALVFIELSEDAAVTENMVLITHQTKADAAPFISASGIYRNTWRKTDQGWRIARRVLAIDDGPIH